MTDGASETKCAAGRDLERQVLDTEYVVRLETVADLAARLIRAREPLEIACVGMALSVALGRVGVTRERIAILRRDVGKDPTS